MQYIQIKAGKNFIPTKLVDYLGFIIDLSIKSEKTKNLQKIPTKPKLTIKEFATFIATLISTFPENQFDPVYYRATLKYKEKSLKYNKGNFNAITKLSEDTLHRMLCWKSNIFEVFKPIRYPNISITI